MLARKHRLPIQWIIQRNGKVIKTPYFLLKIFPNNLEFCRFGIIISKKVDSRSSVRNKIKRIIFQSVRLHLKNQSAGGKDFLIILSPVAGILKKQELTQVIEETFNKII